jgi:hypothetical protein
MMRTRWKTLAVAAGLVLLSVSVAPAQVPIRVRGTIVRVSGQTLTVASRDSSTVDIKMADNFTVIGVVKADLSDIKPGAFVGAAALPAPWWARTGSSPRCRVRRRRAQRARQWPSTQT